MATIGEILGESKVKSLIAATNPTFNIPRMVEPTKEDKLGEDLNWINYHSSYLESIKRIFEIGLEACPLEHEVFMYLNTPVMIDAWVDEKFAAKYPLNFLGYHLNGTLLSLPSIIVAKELVFDKKNLQISHKESIALIESWKNEQGKIVARDLMQGMKAIGSLRRAEVQEEIAISRFMDCGLSTIEDTKPWKPGVSWVFPSLGKSIKIAGKSFVIFPLMPEGTRDHSSRMQHNGRSNPRYWELIK